MVLSSKRKISKEDFNKIVKECHSIADVCRKINWVPKGGNYRIIHRYIEEYESDISHFTGQKTYFLNSERKNKKSVKEISESGTFVRGQDYIKKLIDEGYKERKCENCGLSLWVGNDIPLELHHIDGNPRNNCLENIQILCPNCHTLTENYKGKKRGKKIEVRFCTNCGTKISRWSKSGLCNKCAAKKNRKVEHPSKEELEDLLKKMTMESIGKLYGVTGKTIRKWRNKYGI